MQQHGEFRCTAKAIYRITDEGRRLARWDGSGAAKDSPNSSAVHIAGRISEDGIAPAELQDAKLHRRVSINEKLNEAAHDKGKGIKESNADRLKYIIEEPALRAKFRDHLRDNFCEENLSFFLEVQDFKRKFNITSSAQAAIGPPGIPIRSKTSPGQAAMERHHESLIQMAFEIYNTYLAPSSQCELNIDHGLRNELSAYLNEVMTGLTGKAFQGRVELEQASAFNATQLQSLIELYKRIQTHEIGRAHV